MPDQTFAQQLAHENPDTMTTTRPARALIVDPGQHRKHLVQRLARHYPGGLWMHHELTDGTTVYEIAPHRGPNALARLYARATAPLADLIPSRTGVVQIIAYPDGRVEHQAPCFYFRRTVARHRLRKAGPDARDITAQQLDKIRGIVA